MACGLKVKHDIMKIRKLTSNLNTQFLITILLSCDKIQKCMSDKNCFPTMVLHLHVDLGNE